MKKLLLIAIGIFLMMGNQVIAGDLLAFGLKGGLAYNSTKTDEDIGSASLNSYAGYQFGAYTRINLPIIMGFKGELLYTAKGYDFEVLGQKQTARTGWIDVPLMLSFGIAGKLELDIGPQFSFMVTDKVTNPDGSSGQLPNDLSSSEIGLAIGADVNIIKKLGAYLRYTYGFGSSYKGGPNGTDEFKLSNSTLQVGVKLRLMN
jgi:Outer membrane protein beta-barrel domain